MPLHGGREVVISGAGHAAHCESSEGAILTFNECMSPKALGQQCTDFPHL